MQIFVRRHSRGRRVSVNGPKGDAVLECYTRPERQVKCLYSAVLTIVPIVIYRSSILAGETGPFLAELEPHSRDVG